MATIDQFKAQLLGGGAQVPIDLEYSYFESGDKIEFLC